MPFSAVSNGKKEAIPPNVTVIKKSKMAGGRADFSKISNFTVVEGSGAASTFLKRMRVAKRNEMTPNDAQIKNNDSNEIRPTNVSPRAGPSAKAMFPDRPKYPIPSPRRDFGIKSEA